MLPLIDFMFTRGAARSVKTANLRDRRTDLPEVFRKGSYPMDRMTDMPHVGEFCPSNILRMLLGVIIVVTLVTAIGFWLYQAPGQGTSIEQPAHAPSPAR